MKKLLFLILIGCSYMNVWAQSIEGLDLLKKAEAGDTDSQYKLSLYYHIGWKEYGIPQNELEGNKWLLKAATNGHTEAQCDLGRDYLNGHHGLPKDYNEALKWLLKSANGDYYRGMFHLGTFYYYIKKDKEQAIYWVKKSIDTERRKSGNVNETAVEFLSKLGVDYY